MSVTKRNPIQVKSSSPMYYHLQ